MTGKDDHDKNKHHDIGRCIFSKITLTNRQFTLEK